jgi:hypothetical protein
VDHESLPRSPTPGGPRPSLAPGDPPRPWPAILTREAVLVAAAVFLRLALIALWLHGRAARGGLELGVVADRIVAGDGFVWDFYGTGGPLGDAVPRTSFFPPFYPYLMAGLKMVAGGHWATVLQILQAAVGALLPLVVLRLGKRLLRSDVAWGAAWITVLWPPFVWYTAELFSVTFHTVAVPLLLLLLVRTIDSDRPARGAVIAGVGYGLTAYSLPSFLGSLALMPLGFRLAGGSWRRAVGVPALALGVALVVISPWTIRNAVVHHRFVPVATNFGFNLLGANNPHAQTELNVLCPYDDIRWELIDRHELETMNEADFDRRLARQAFAYMADHPRRTARNMATRALYYWWIEPNMAGYDRLRGMGGMVLMSILLPLTVLGLVVAWRRRHVAPWGIPYAACAWMTIFYMNFAIRGRYSLAIQPVMILAAALGIQRMSAFLGPLFLRKRT